MTVFLIVLFGVTMLYVSVTTRVEGYIKSLCIQGVILFLIVVLEFNKMDIFDFVFLAVETITVKTVLIPLMLFRSIKKNQLYRDMSAFIPNFAVLFLTSLIFISGFFTAFISSTLKQSINPLLFGIAVSTIMTGLLIIMVRKKIITHIMGYMTIENGIFLLMLSIKNKMPIIIELGVLLDIFVGVYLFVVFMNKIHDMYESSNIEKLTDLKD
jgi:hydrogenase-4 component E